MDNKNILNDLENCLPKVGIGSLDDMSPEELDYTTEVLAPPEEWLF